MEQAIVLLNCAIVYAFIFLGEVDGSCSDSLRNFKDTLNVTEQQKDVVLVNVTNEYDFRWDFSVVAIGRDDTPSTLNARNHLKSFFRVDSTDSWLTITLIQALDKELFYGSPLYQQNTIDSLQAKLTCQDWNTTVPQYLTIINLAVNEYQTNFIKRPFDIKILENTTVGSVVFVLSDHIIDDDHPADDVNIAYGIEPYGNEEANGFDFFKISFRKNGVTNILLTKEIDFDELYKKNTNSIPFYKIIVWVKDSIHSRDQTYLTINIEDVDDLPPGFNYPAECGTSCISTPYRAHTTTMYRGALTVFPSGISAVDRDSLNFPVKYSIVADPVGFSEAFDIDPNSGEVRQTNNITRTGVLEIQATEISYNQFHKTATLLVQLRNDTSYQADTTLPPQTGSTESITMGDNSDSSLITIIVGVIALVIIIALLLVLLWCHRKLKRSVSPNTTAVEKSTEVEEQQLREMLSSKELLMDPTLFLTSNGEIKNMPTAPEEVIKKKRPRRKKKQREPEIYDGTRDYDMAIDPSFYAKADKAKVKQSTRSKNIKTDPRYWITIPNEF